MQFTLITTLFMIVNAIPNDSDFLEKRESDFCKDLYAKGVDLFNQFMTCVAKYPNSQLRREKYCGQLLLDQNAVYDRYYKDGGCYDRMIANLGGMYIEGGFFSKASW